MKLCGNPPSPTTHAPPHVVANAREQYTTLLSYAV